MIFAIFQEVVQKHEKVQLLNFGRLPAGQFSLDFKTIFGFGLFKPISTTYLMSVKIWKFR